MDSIKKRLPYLGIEINGFVELDELNPVQKMIRPNYQALKNETMNEVSLFMGLIGLSTLNPLHKVDGFDGNFNIFEIRENIEEAYGLKTGLDFAEVAVDIKQLIERGVATGKIKRGVIDYTSPPAPIHGPFRVDFYYDTLPLIGWMKKFYPIPIELEDDQGEINQNFNIDAAGGHLGIKEIVSLLKKIKPEDAQTQKVKDLLKKNNISFDFPAMSTKEKKELIESLTEEGLSTRLIALILNHERIANNQVELKSAIRNIQRLK